MLNNQTHFTTFNKDQIRDKKKILDKRWKKILRGITQLLKENKTRKYFCFI